MDELTWSADDGPRDVIIQVAGGHKLCPRPECQPTAGACSDFDAVTKYIEEWNWQSQRCVRALIEELGGSATDERLWILDSISATITWRQIQEVGKLPAVISISPAVGGKLS